MGKCHGHLALAWCLYNVLIRRYMHVLHFHSVNNIPQHAQKHRNYYKDYSGGVEKVPGISLKIHCSQAL